MRKFLLVTVLLSIGCGGEDPKQTVPVIDAGPDIPDIDPLTNAYYGSRCDEGIGTRFLILSDEPITCADLTAEVTGTLSDGRVKLELNDDGVMNPSQTYCGSTGECETASFDIISQPDGDKIKGSWTATLGGDETTQIFTAEPCDFGDDGNSTGKSPVRGAAISDVAFNQGVESKVVVNGALNNLQRIPVVAGREALVRVYLDLEDDFVEREIVGRFTMGDAIIDAVYTPIADSSERFLASTLNFEVPGEVITNNASFSVEILEVEACPDVPGTIGVTKVPRSAPVAPLQPESMAGPMRIVLVPIAYEADGSNRVPNLSPANVEIFRSVAYRLYPVSGIDMSVRDPVGGWNTGIQQNGAGFGAFLDYCRQVRAADNPPSDTYYYCITAPPYFTAISGLAPVPGANDASSRLGSGVQFEGGIGAGTFAHEIGHSLGRNHANCGGADGADPNYPHPNADIGVYGYDLVEKILVEPETKDFMSYCDPAWISDYNYEAILERLKVVIRPPAFKAPFGPKVYRTAYTENGEFNWGRDITLYEQPDLMKKTETLRTPDGSKREIEVYVTPVSNDRDFSILIEPFESGTLTIPNVGEVTK